MQYDCLAYVATLYHSKIVGGEIGNGTCCERRYLSRLVCHMICQCVLVTQYTSLANTIIPFPCLFRPWTWRRCSVCSNTTESSAHQLHPLLSWSVLGGPCKSKSTFLYLILFYSINRRYGIMNNHIAVCRETIGIKGTKSRPIQRWAKVNEKHSRFSLAP